MTNNMVRLGFKIVSFSAMSFLSTGLVSIHNFLKNLNVFLRVLAVVALFILLKQRSSDVKRRGAWWHPGNIFIRAFLGFSPVKIGRDSHRLMRMCVYSYFCYSLLSRHLQDQPASLATGETSR